MGGGATLLRVIYGLALYLGFNPQTALKSVIIPFYVEETLHSTRSHNLPLSPSKWQN